MPRSMKDKAVEAVAEGRIRILKANGSGVALAVEASKLDPATLRRPTYRTMLYSVDGELVRKCSCPAPRRCYHLEAAELLWRPYPEEGDQ